MIYVGRMVPFMMSMLVQKPETVMYPYEKAKVADRFRGALEFNKDKCIGCRICQRTCPSGAIEIEKVNTEVKQFKAVVCMDRCIFCGQCVDSCPKGALHNTVNFELASFDRKALRMEI
jgi:formate hydrogenlyase subunit 6/NADH:ubiquinone oxidoreductase subunit I